MFSFIYNITNNSLSLFEIVSIVSTFVVGFCTIYFMKQQLNIQHKQQQTDLLKLRVEHIKNVLNAWDKFHKDIDYIKGYQAIIRTNNIPCEEIVSKMEKVIEDLFKYNFTTKYIFSQEIYDLEHKIITSLKDFVPSLGTPWTTYNLPVEKYTNNRELLYDLYKKYEKIMNKESKKCK